MKKKPPVCPNCGAAFDTEAVTKMRRSRPAPEEKPQKVAAPTPEDIEDIPLEADDADDAIIEDADELGEDDMNVEDVIDVDQEDESR